MGRKVGYLESEIKNYRNISKLTRNWVEIGDKNQKSSLAIEAYWGKRLDIGVRNRKL